MPRSNRAPKKTKPARKPRRDGTAAERLLWQRLRNGQVAKAQFRRQNPLAHYVLDFYCPEYALAIELEGSRHAEPDSRERQRDRWLKKKGVTILRLPNSDVIENLDGVLDYIAARIGEMTPVPPRRRPPWHELDPTYWRPEGTPTPTPPAGSRRMRVPGDRRGERPKERSRERSREDR